MGVIYNAFQSGPPTIDHYDTIYLRPDGDIAGPLSAEEDSSKLVNQYLFSIGVKRPILTKSKLESILKQKSKISA